MSFEPLSIHFGATLEMIADHHLKLLPCVAVMFYDIESRPIRSKDFVFMIEGSLNFSLEANYSGVEFRKTIGYKVAA